MIFNDFFFLSKNLRNSLNDCVLLIFSGKEFQSFDVLGINESRYKFVLDLGMCKSFCDLRFRWLT